MDNTTKTDGHAIPWNKGKLLGQKPPLNLMEIWAFRIRLQLVVRAVPPKCVPCAEYFGTFPYDAWSNRPIKSGFL
jgi:hypothetical protein